MEQFPVCCAQRDKEAWSSAPKLPHKACHKHTSFRPASAEPAESPKQTVVAARDSKPRLVTKTPLQPDTGTVGVGAHQGAEDPETKGCSDPSTGLRAAWGLAVPPRPARYVCPGCPNRQHHALPVFLLWPVLFNRLTAMVLNTVQHVGVRNQVCPVASLWEPPAAIDPRPPTGVVSLADESPSDVN